MDVLKNISGSEDKDIIVSLPKNKSWLEYLSHFAALKVYGGSFNIIVRTVPKTAPGKKCYMAFDGFIKGWMEIYKLRETVDNEICIELNPMLTPTLHKIPMDEIEEYKYFFDNSDTQ